MVRRRTMRRLLLLMLLLLIRMSWIHGGISADRSAPSAAGRVQPRNGGVWGVFACLSSLDNVARLKRAQRLVLLSWSTLGNKSGVLCRSGVAQACLWSRSVAFSG